MHLQSLLDKVSAINKKYEEIAEITGENFNVFRIMRMEYNERYTHSAFIAELLNPKGSHGQKEIFLELFIEQLNISEFDCKNARVAVEKYIGPISEDKKEGGYIDIIVTDDSNHRAIIIENKVYARDGENQLLRYFNYGKKRNFFNFPQLYYLTRNDEEAEKYSKGDLKDEEYRKISYKEHILKWLEKCKERSVNHPILRETLTQYINLIKYLTGQAMNDKMQNELIDIVKKDPDNIISAFRISETIEALKSSLIKDLLASCEKIANKKDLVFHADKNLSQKDTGMLFTPKKWNHCTIGFWFEEKDYNSFFFGITSSQKNSVVPEKLRKILKEIENNGSPFESTEHWPLWKWFDPKDWGNTSTAWVDIKEGEMIRKIEEELKKIIDMTEGLDL